MVRLYSPFLESVDSWQIDGNLQQKQKACGHFDLIISAMTKRWKDDSHSRANKKQQQQQQQPQRQGQGQGQGQGRLQPQFMIPDHLEYIRPYKTNCFAGSPVKEPSKGLRFERFGD